MTRIGDGTAMRAGRDGAWRRTGIIAALVISLSATVAPGMVGAAPVYVHVTDMSQLSYQMTNDGLVYFRNLNAFNPQVTGCCYAFALDTTTPFGKSAWATMLMKMASKGSLYIRVSESNPPTSGAPASVDQVGNW